MKSYLLIIISAMCLGVANIFYKKSTAAIGPINTTFIYYLFGTIITFFIWLALKGNFKVEAKDLIYPGIIAILLSISVLTFNIGLQHTKVAISSTIRAFSFLFSIIAAVIFLKNHLTIKQIIGIVLAGVSLLLLIG